ncbi:MAG: ABC transporter ATP-binding protein [Deltaproteobacteria bacterium]|nr:ABC transporter ATP-binding protein [Deltaproteobacteria bacterium]
MNTLQLLTRLRRICGRRMSLVVAGCVLASAAGILSLVPFFCVFFEIDGLTASSLDVTAVRNIALLAICACVLRFILLGVASILSHTVAFDVMHDLQKALAVKLTKVSRGFLLSRNSADLKKVMVQDVQALDIVVAHYLRDFVTGLVVPCVTLVCITLINPYLGLAALFVVALLYFAFSASFSGYDDEAQALGRADVAMQSSLLECVRGITVVKIFVRAVPRGLVERVEEYSARMNSWIRRTNSAWSFFNILTDATLLIFLPMGAFLHTRGLLAFSDFCLVLLLSIGYLQPLVRLSIQLGLFKRACKSIERIVEILDAPEVVEPTQPQLPRDASISFEHVGLTLQDREILKDVSFSIPAGAICAIVGRSGAGKTSLMQLLLRSWEPTSGQVRIGGVPVSSISQHDLSQVLSVMMQETYLFEGTILENLRLGAPNCTLEQAIECAQIAQAHDFITSLPRGYDEPVGMGGTTVSGGERQRIALARMLLRSSNILVLDEATAFADALTEQKILRAVRERLQNKTLLLIAHRFSALRLVDVLIVMDGGRVVGTGTHDELLRSCATYRELWTAHSRGGDVIDKVLQPEAA